nr:putative M protein [Styphnolobium-associated cytorhabdovirus]
MADESKKRAEHEMETLKSGAALKDVPINSDKDEHTAVGRIVTPLYANQDQRVKTYKFIKKHELNIKYCGIYSTMQGRILGRSKDALLLNYRKIVEEVLENALLMQGITTDVGSITSIIGHILSDHMGKIPAYKILKFVPSDFTLGQSVWSLEIMFPATTISRVRYMPRTETQMSMNISDNVVENNKINYIVDIEGDMIFWNTKEDLARRMYNLNPDYVMSGTIMNDPLDGNPVESGSTSSGEKESKTAQATIDNPSDDKRIIQDLVYSLRKDDQMRSKPSFKK